MQVIVCKLRVEYELGLFNSLLPTHVLEDTNIGDILKICPISKSLQSRRRSKTDRTKLFFKLKLLTIV